MNSASVLILTPDVLAAALIGALVETIDLRPAFSAPAEAPRDTLLRVRPRVILLDATDSALDRDGLLGPATMMGIAVILFGPRRAGQELARVAGELGLRHLALPVPADAFAEVVREALAAGGK